MTAGRPPWRAVSLAMMAQAGGRPSEDLEDIAAFLGQMEGVKTCDHHPGAERPGRASCPCAPIRRALTPPGYAPCWEAAGHAAAAGCHGGGHRGGGQGGHPGAIRQVGQDGAWSDRVRRALNEKA